MRALASSLLLLLVILQHLPLQAQETTYRKEKMNVMGQSYSGFSVQVPYSEQRSKKYLINYLEEEGKAREKKNFIEIKETYWKTKDDPTTVYAQVNGDSTQSRLWIGYSAEADEALIGAIQSQMESLPFILHKQHLQHQIKEAEDAESYLSKELRNTQRDGERLQRDLERNAYEKERLEKELKQNAADKIALEQGIANNSEEQKKKSKALSEVQKQLEYLKEKLSRL
ncbi:hypothetical protein [Nafulsella turpanensis]|uniref:hypothetical protein n=1 Tax=Nafulsella turpanensis TaxID=1265690 RepID=UPI00034AF2EE|nr:hypothetical protein [Nafulsella turpanensis]